MCHFSFCVYACLDVEKMDRKIFSWDRVVVCVSKSTLVILGQYTNDSRSGTLLLNRQSLFTNIQELPSEPIDPVVSTSLVTGVGLVGFLTLGEHTYLGVITKCVPAASIGDHVVFGITELVWVPVSFGQVSASKSDSKNLSEVSNLFKSGDFLFCKSLNLDGGNSARFQWNYDHSLQNVSDMWRTCVIHGSVKSAAFSSLGRPFAFIIIARRSRHFAGTRYRKRGISWEGNCANEVEMEQLLISFGPPDRIFSFKQIRASVPLRWTQDSHGLVPKPEIVIRHDDLELSATCAHFENLKTRYGCPILVVSLLGIHSSESELGTEYLNAIEWLVAEKFMSIELTQFDLKEAASEIDDVLVPSFRMYAQGAKIAKELVKRVSWSDLGGQKKQRGIVRTNCLDCLDRTNIFQYILGLECLNQQLIQLGVMESGLRPSWILPPGSSSSDLLVLIESMYEATGDQLSFQYAGTAAHKKYSSGQTDALYNSGREIFISLSRHYSSAFTDHDKQNAINLFHSSEPKNEYDTHEQTANTIFSLTNPEKGLVPFSHIRRFGDPKPIHFNTPQISPKPSRSSSLA